jgi:uncharacterized membrane protein
MPVLRKAAVLVLVAVAAAPGVSRADCIEAQPIYARNNTSRPIWVAAHYIPAGSHSFVTDGWWRIEPGCCRLLLYNNGVHIYFAARDDQGAVWEGTATSAVVRGETVNMFHRDTGPCYDPWTVDFN